MTRPVAAVVAVTVAAVAANSRVNKNRLRILELVSKTPCHSEGAGFATEESLIWAVETLR